MALRAVCTTKLRAASCTTLKYASPSKYTSRWRAPNRTGTRSRPAALRVSAQPRLDGGALLRGGLPVQVAAERDEVDRHHVVMTPQQGGLLTGRRHDLPEDR